MRRPAGMAAARSMLPESAANPAVAPAICRKRRRLSSGMGVGNLVVSRDDRPLVADADRVRQKWLQGKT
ncbi:hypothetical protein GCM10010359_04470 [Streptomyces morookaense]|nr:hypothetical protein GCM10010359_04470 [Streptomyces morookaense]